MDFMKAKHKFMVAEKLFDTTSVSHPDFNVSKLIDSIIVGIFLRFWRE